MTPVELFNRYIDKILPSATPYNFKDKRQNQSFQIAYMLNRTQRIFAWSGLPETIPARMLELYLQINGNACFYKYNDNLYVFTGGLGGEPDVYYMPTLYTIANPALNLSVNAEINKNCVVMPNDSNYVGLLPLFSKYATLLSENELSMLTNILQSRIISLISADDDRTQESAKRFIEKILDGDFEIIADSQFFEGLKVSPFASGSVHSLTDLIEMEQYLRAGWFNDIGINANYNMKRESINANESQLNNDALFPLIDDMLENRRLYAEKVNDMFGTSITVDLDSTWKIKQEEVKAETNMEGGEADAGTDANNVVGNTDTGDI